MFFDPRWIMMMAPVLILTFWAQMRVKSAFSKYSRVANSAGFSGAEAAAHMLEKSGISVVSSAAAAKGRRDAVAIESVRGFLSDHYDPRTRVLRLSPDVYGGRSLAAVGVACHEAGHALQHARGYAALGLRSAMVPTASIGSNLAFPLIFIGFLLQAQALALVGILFFGAVVAFQMVTLPVEFNASRRAKKALYDYGIIRYPQEQAGVAAVLNAAALTYVAAAAAAIMQMLYYLLLIFGRRR